MQFQKCYMVVTMLQLVVCHANIVSCTASFCTTFRYCRYMCHMLSRDWGLKETSSNLHNFYFLRLHNCIFWILHFLGICTRNKPTFLLRSLPSKFVTLSPKQLWFGFKENCICQENIWYYTTCFSAQHTIFLSLPLCLEPRDPPIRIHTVDGRNPAPPG